MAEGEPGAPLPGHGLPWELMETGRLLFRHKHRHDVDVGGQDGSWNHRATWTGPPGPEESGERLSLGRHMDPHMPVREQSWDTLLGPDRSTEQQPRFLWSARKSHGGHLCSPLGRRYRGRKI